MPDHGESAAPPRALVVIPARLATPLRRGNGLRDRLPWHWVTLERQVRTDRQVLDIPSILPLGLRVVGAARGPDDELLPAPAMTRTAGAISGRPSGDARSDRSWWPESESSVFFRPSA